jgi:hypothetical protein
MQRIKQAAIKLVEQSEFKYKMTANAKEQGLQRLGKQEALLKARAAYRQRTRVPKLGHDVSLIQSTVSREQRLELKGA